jgi:hypothetical protein
LNSFNCWWGDDPKMIGEPVYKKTLIADKVPIPLWVILYNFLFNKKRIFHPFDYIFPLSIFSSFSFVKQMVNDKLK